MAGQGIVGVLLCALALLACPLGCQSLQLFPQQTPFQTLVRDAETQAPIPGARVTMWHSATHAEASSALAGSDGVARIAPPPESDTPLIYEVIAKGYLTRQTDMPAERTASGVVLELFADPRPTVEVVVPTGYTGLLRATIRVQGDLQFARGQRLFSFPAQPPQLTQIVLPPIFVRGCTPDIRMRYADGTPLPRKAQDCDVGCRCLMSDPDDEYVFVIGTQWEADQIRRAIRSGAAGSKLAAPTASIGAFGK